MRILLIEDNLELCDSLSFQLKNAGYSADTCTDGADDYLVKPFAFEELMARIRCISRRPRQWNKSETLSFGDLTYSSRENILTGPQGHCTLSKKEGSLLDVFLRNQTQTLPRMTLLTKVWGPDAEVEEGNLDNYMYFIRRRFK